MFYTDDPVKDYENYDRAQAELLERLPVCSECGEHIQDEHCYEFGGELICPDCVENNHRKNTEDFEGE